MTLLTRILVANRGEIAIRVMRATAELGMMVGPEVEKTALVRHCCRLFLIGAKFTVPHMVIVLRKSYGLGVQAMAGGDFKHPLFAVAWPTGDRKLTAVDPRSAAIAILMRGRNGGGAVKCLTPRAGRKGRQRGSEILRPRPRRITRHLLA